MSEARATLIRTMFEAFNRDGIEATLPFMPANVVWHTFPEWPGADRNEGHDGIRQLAGEWTENFDDYSWDVEEVRDCGDAVVVLAHHRGRSKAAGMPVSEQVGGVFTDFDDEDRAARARFFVSWEQTLAAAAESGGLGDAA